MCVGPFGKKKPRVAQTDTGQTIEVHRPTGPSIPTAPTGPSFGGGPMDPAAVPKPSIPNPSGGSSGDAHFGPLPTVDESAPKQSPTPTMTDPDPTETEAQKLKRLRRMQLGILSTIKTSAQGTEAAPLVSTPGLYSSGQKNKLGQ